jgi:hypothetical protein
MKIQVSLRTLAVVGAVLTTLSLVSAAQAAQREVTLEPGAPAECLDSPPSRTRIEAFGFVNPSTEKATFRLRNVTRSMLVAGPTLAQQVTYNLPGNGQPDIYRLCAANPKTSGPAIQATLIINGF